jgi:hypothetical protein
MARPSSQRAPKEQTQNDPGVSDDPKKSDAGDFAAHVWTSINQIFERLGEINTKVGKLSEDQEKLRASVEKHDKIVMRIVYTLGGVALVLIALWFIYENVLKGRITFNGNGM